MSGNGPTRTCIGCRRRAPAAELVLLRLDDGRLVFGQGPGRGASIHPDAACVAATLRSGALGRAFKRSPSTIAVPDAAAFLDAILWDR